MTFPSEGMEVTRIPVVSDLARAKVRAFFRDPDGHLFEISEAKGA